MNIVSRNHRGQQLKVVYDCPCDTCSMWTRCKTQKLICKAFTEYVNYGWYDIHKVGRNIKPMK